MTSHLASWSYDASCIFFKNPIGILKKINVVFVVSYWKLNKVKVQYRLTKLQPNKMIIITADFLLTIQYKEFHIIYIYNQNGGDLPPV